MKKIQLAAALTAGLMLLPAIALANGGGVPNPNVGQTAPVSAPTDTGIAITINNAPLDLTGLHPYRDGENVMIPIRKVAEALGFTVIWNENPETVKLDNGTVNITLAIGEDRYTKVSSQAIGMSAPQSYGSAPVVTNDSTYAPAAMLNLLYSNPETVKINGDTVYINTEVAPEPTEAPNTEIANPWTEYPSIEDAEKAAGIELSLPKALLNNEFQMNYIGMMRDEKMIQVTYHSDSDATITYRQVTAEKVSDISGVFGDYETETMTVKDMTVTTRSSEGKTTVAYWNDGAYNYSISFTPEGADAEQLNAVLDEIL